MDTIEIIEEVTTIEIVGEENLVVIEETGVDIISESAQGVAGIPGASSDDAAILGWLGF